MAYTVSSRWLRSVRRGMHPITVIDVQVPGEGVVLSSLPVSSGSISVDRTSMVRASGSVLVPDPSLSPFLTGDSPLAPQGAELVIRSGIVYPEGRRAWAQGESINNLVNTNAVELVPMGVFPILSAKASEAGGLVTTIQFYDRMKLVEKDVRLAPEDFGGVLIQEAIETVLADWTVVFDPEVDNFLLPYGTIMDNKPIEFVGELGESLGADIYFDREGNVRVSKIPALHADDVITPDWVFDVGENGELKDSSRSLNRERVNNRVIVLGSGDEDRVRPYAVVTDDDPRSPTRWGGPFGKSTLKVEDTKLTTITQCETAARAKLRESTGLEEPIDFIIVGHPALDPNDVCEVRFLSGGSKVALLDSYTYNFATTEVSGDTRTIQYVTED